jgi:c-di-GMP-binding flagellar brake protein YcgR
MEFDDTIDWSRSVGARRPLRKYPRLDIQLPAEYETGSAPGAKSATVLTLGGGGLFLGVSEAFALGTELSVRFRPARRQPLVETKAKVVYQAPDRGIGIEFLEISPEHRQAILRFIHQKMQENRKFPRAPLAVQVQHSGGVVIGFSRDISLGGMFIETAEKLDASSSVGLRFHVDDSGQIVIATAEIRYVVQKLGMGVEFSEISPEDRDRIKSYVEKENPGSPAA